MPNIISNPDFTDGLADWTHSEGVEAITGTVSEGREGEAAVVMPGARLPGGGYMGQHFGDASLSSGHLYFFCGPLSSRGYRLQVRFDYTDGFTETHKTLAVAELPLEANDYEMPLYMRISVPVDTSRHIRKFGITNMDVHESGAIFVNNFILQGELISGVEPKSGATRKQRYMKKMFERDAQMIDEFLFEMDSKLDQILDRLDDSKAKKQKASKRSKKRRK